MQILLQSSAPALHFFELDLPKLVQGQQDHQRAVVERPTGNDLFFPRRAYCRFGRSLRENTTCKLQPPTYDAPEPENKKQTNTARNNESGQPGSPPARSPVVRPLNCTSRIQVRKTNQRTVRQREALLRRNYTQSQIRRGPADGVEALNKAMKIISSQQDRKVYHGLRSICNITPVQSITRTPDKKGRSAKRPGAKVGLRRDNCRHWPTCSINQAHIHGVPNHSTWNRAKGQRCHRHAQASQCRDSSTSCRNRHSQPAAAPQAMG